jgi:hypothetical protein
VLLGGSERNPWNGDFDGGEGDDPSPSREDEAQVDPSEGIGSRIATAIVVRASTSVAGVISATATRMNR